MSDALKKLFGNAWHVNSDAILARLMQTNTPGLVLAAGQHTTGAASDTVVTGLGTVLAAVAVLEDDPVIGCDRALAAVGNQSGAPAAGSILIKTFKPTSATDTTPAAATTFGKKVNWLAVGTET